LFVSSFCDGDSSSTSGQLRSLPGNGGSGTPIPRLASRDTPTSTELFATVVVVDEVALVFRTVDEEELEVDVEVSCKGGIVLGLVWEDKSRTTLAFFAFVPDVDPAVAVFALLSVEAAPPLRLRFPLTFPFPFADLFFFGFCQVPSERNEHM
jgi:hypothetical protein